MSRTQEACRKREDVYRCIERGHDVSWWVRRRQVIGCGGRRWKEVSSIFVSRYRDWLHETWLDTDKVASILHCFSTLLQKGPISPRIAPAWSSASKSSDSRQQFSQRRSQRKIFLLLRHLSPHWSVVHFLLLTRPHSTRAFFAYTLGRSWPRRQLRSEFDFTR